MRKLTQEQVIEKFINKHGNRFDYSKVVYVNMMVKVCIICYEHGEFWQTPADHITGYGCPKCKFQLLSNKFKYSTQQFIEKAKAIHGDKYDYSLFQFKDSKCKDRIKCNTCNHIFIQRANAHLSGQGCPKCSAKKVGSYIKSNTEEFIKKALDLHGNKNDYSKTNYINSFTKVCVTCLIDGHGDFWVTPNNHLNKKSNCPKCNSSKGELAIKTILNKHNIKFKPQYNIPEIVANYEIDFYLPEYRLLIEFHGKQHYEYIPFFHDGDYTFEDQKNRDELVRDAAVRWKYRYLEFNYKQLKYLSKEQFEEMVIKRISNYLGRL